MGPSPFSIGKTDLLFMLVVQEPEGNTFKSAVRTNLSSTLFLEVYSTGIYSVLLMTP